MLHFLSLRLCGFSLLFFQFSLKFSFGAMVLIGGQHWDIIWSVPSLLLKLIHALPVWVIDQAEPHIKERKFGT